MRSSKGKRPPPIPPEAFGKDHWSTLLYAAHRAVDHDGLRLRADPRMRTARWRLQVFFKAGDSIRNCVDTAPGSAVTRLHGDAEAPPDHDDWDCLDDFEAAGYLRYVDPETGKTLSAAELGRKQFHHRARVVLTYKGWRFDAALRRWLTQGNSTGTFRLQLEPEESNAGGDSLHA